MPDTSNGKRKHLTTLRVAGVPEHFNAPFHLAKEQGLYTQKGLDVEWTSVPGGTGAMAQQLEEGHIDVAVMLSEGAVAKVASGAPMKIIGTYVQSPLRWGVHVRKGRSIEFPGDLKGKVFGVSRMGSGSHLMAHVFAHQCGWDLAKDAPLKVIGPLDKARVAMQDGTIDVYFWEKFTTKHLVDSGEWDIVGEVPTPWSCFVFVASENAMAEKGDAIRDLVETTKGVCDDFKANVEGKTVAYVSKNHALNSEDSEEWLAGTEWACECKVAEETLTQTQKALMTIGQLKDHVAVNKLYSTTLTTLN